jgi:hypothetical protein
VSSQPDRTDDNLNEARANVKAEIARTDTKASLLIAFNGAVLASLGSVGVNWSLPVPALVPGVAGTLGLLAAAAVLLGAIRPRLAPCAAGTFPHWARLSVDELRADMHTDRRAEAVAAFSRLAVAKFHRLQLAVDLTRAAGGFFVVAAAIVAGGAL